MAQVGAIDVMVVSDGVLSLPGAMLGHNVDPSVRAAWLEDMFLPPDVLEWALNAMPPSKVVPAYWAKTFPHCAAGQHALLPTGNGHGEFS
jgi:hypothetical protein